MGEQFLPIDQKMGLTDRDIRMQSLWKEISDAEERVSSLDFSAAQSSAEAEQRVKETLVLLDESVESSDKAPAKPTRKRKAPTEIPLFAFHSESDDGDGGAPTGQERKHKPDAPKTRSLSSRPRAPRRYF